MITKNPGRKLQVNQSKIMVVGMNLKCDYCAITIHGTPLDHVSEYKYLGVNLCANKGLGFSSIAAIRSFYRAANSILHSRVKPNNDVLMKLLYSNCVPILTYACAVKEYSASEMYRCHVAINNAIRKIYSFATWQSIRHLRLSNGFDSVHEIFAKAKSKFMSFAVTSPNTVVNHLATNLPTSV